MVDRPTPRDTKRPTRLSAAAASLLLAAATSAEATEKHAAPADTAAKVAAQPTTVRAVDALGPMSVGHAHAGYLFNGVQMPRGAGWTLTLPDASWGTQETVDSIARCIEKVRSQIPDTPPAIIGSISKRGGGYFPPHKSHRTGRDVDIYFYRKPGTSKWYEPATAHNLDRARTWALARAFITDADINFILIDQSVKALLEEHALSIGEDPMWIRDLFHGRGRGHPPLIKHIPGHTAHMHVRFVSPIARERGRRAYDTLVAQGHIVTKKRVIEHEVVPGDTLLGLARRHGRSLEDLVAQNDLPSMTIRVGQKIRIEKPIDIRGARTRVVVPHRRLPPATKPPADLAIKAALSEVERDLERALDLGQ